jgi:sugar phosphate isomerase/epimerase
VADPHGVVHEQRRGVVQPPPEGRIALSTASVYPESTSAGFEIAGRLGYDGIEIMVGLDPVSQDVTALRRLSDNHGLPIVAIHAPCLLITQRVWGNEPWLKLDRAREVAEEVGAATVVVHPPFRWQRDYARVFERGLARLGEETDVVFAVENMFPWRAAGRVVQAYAPDWDVVDRDYPHVTLDLSHTATSQSDAMELVDALGERMVHVHLADGSGSAKDEHLIPGRGTQPCADVLERLAAGGFRGTIVVEVNTRRSPNREQRESELTEALAFARLHYAAAVESGRAS